MRVVALLLSSCLLAGPCLAADAPPAPPQDSASRPAPTPAQRIYYFQHRLVPQWVHQSSGVFYTDLSAGRLDRLREAATEVVSAEFAAGIRVTPYPELGGVLIEYPPPQTPPQCFYSFVLSTPKSETGYAIYTYEMTLKFPGLESTRGVVGTWSASGTHGNLGGRGYEDAAAFVRDVTTPAKD